MPLSFENVYSPNAPWAASLHNLFKGLILSQAQQIEEHKYLKREVFVGNTKRERELARMNDSIEKEDSVPDVYANIEKQFNDMYIPEGVATGPKTVMLDWVMISIDQITQSDAMETNTPGWHIADSKELAVIKEMKKEIKSLMTESSVMTGEMGLSRDGPCRLDPKTGERIPMYDGQWNALSKEEQEAVMKEFLALPEQERAYEYSGDGPVVVDYNSYQDGKRVLGVGARGVPLDLGWVVWVKDTWVKDTQGILRR